jgi:hypothetical protein
MDRATKMKRQLFFVIMFMLLYLLACRSSYEKIPPDLSFAQRITILLYEPDNPEANQAGWLEREVQDESQVAELIDLMTKETSIESGDCGFGDLRFVFEDEEQRIMLFPALDGCSTIYVPYEIEDSIYDRINTFRLEHYYSISYKSKERLKEVLRHCFPTVSQEWFWNI